jgi:hypothetical protein
MKGRKPDFMPFIRGTVLILLTIYSVMQINYLRYYRTREHKFFGRDWEAVVARRPRREGLE